MSWWLVAGVLASLAGLSFLAVRAVARTVSGLVSERRALRAGGHAETVRYPIDRDGWLALRDAGTLLVGAEAGLNSALGRARWELLGFGDPDARQYALVAACGELLQAQRALRHGAALLRRTADAGPDVPLVEDPLRALAVRGAWPVWVVLMLLPAPVRGLYRYLGLRRQVLPLLATSRELQDVVEGVRRTATPAPERKVSVRMRALAAA